MKPERINIITPFIKLDSFIKLCGVVDTGGQAKELIKEGNVLLNGEPCLERGKKLRPKDIVELCGGKYEVFSVEG